VRQVLLEEISKVVEVESWEYLVYEVYLQVSVSPDVATTEVVVP